MVIISTGRILSETARKKIQKSIQKAHGGRQRKKRKESKPDKVSEERRADNVSRINSAFSVSFHHNQSV